MCITMKPSGIGGQAVIEGVMMKNKEDYAIAVRKPDDTIVVKKEKYESKAEKYKLFKLPIFRGILGFIESLTMGIQVLTFSASFYEYEEEEEPSLLEKTFSKVFKEKAESVAMGLTVATSLVLSIAIFILLPYLVAEILSKSIESRIIMTLIEGALRIIIFVSYIYLISRMEDIQRLFMYHGAEHKAINCIENGYELNVENVKIQSREHKRCGTSFTFLVMFVSIIFFMFIRVDSVWLRVLVRLLLVPLISGVSYEFLKWAGRSNSVIVRIFSKPGLLLQEFTTREPDESMIEVAIASVEAVFDWKTFIGYEDQEEGQDNLEFDSNTQDMSASLNKLENDNTNETSKNNDKHNGDKVLQAVEQIVKES